MASPSSKTSDAPQPVQLAFRIRRKAVLSRIFACWMLRKPCFWAMASLTATEPPQ